MSRIKDVDELAQSLDIVSRLATLAFAEAFKDKHTALDAIEGGLKGLYPDLGIFEEYKKGIQMYWDDTDG